mgnify:CR=1
RMYPHILFAEDATLGISGAEEARAFVFLKSHVLLSSVSYAKFALLELDRVAEDRMDRAAGSIARLWLKHKGLQIRSLASASKM